MSSCSQDDAATISDLRRERCDCEAVLLALDTVDPGLVEIKPVAAFGRLTRRMVSFELLRTRCTVCQLYRKNPQGGRAVVQGRVFLFPKNSFNSI